MRRVWFSLLLTVCLLLAQQGGVRHEIAHLSHSVGTGSGSQPDQGHGLCLSCLGHADLKFTVYSSAYQTRLALAEGETPVALHAAATPASSVPARSRGPPTRL